MTEQALARKRPGAATRDEIVRAQGGSHEAFERLAAATAGRLIGTAILIVRDRDAARDAVQETLIEVWRSLPSLRDPDAFEGWLQRILVRACHRAVRSNRRRAVEVQQLETDLPALDDHAIDDRDRIERAFRRLTMEQRTALVLHHHLGLPLAESAGILRIPMGTMKSRLNRATAALRAALDADEREGAALMGWSA